MELKVEKISQLMPIISLFSNLILIIFYKSKIFFGIINFVLLYVPILFSVIGLYLGIKYKQMAVIVVINLFMIFLPYITIMFLIGMED